MIIPEGIFTFALILSGYLAFICLKMEVSPWTLWTYTSKTERDK